MTNAQDSSVQPADGMELAEHGLVKPIAALVVWMQAKAEWRFPLIAFLAGALLTATFAPLSFFPAAIVAFPLMILLIDCAKSRQQAFAFGWWTGFGLFSIGLTWIGHSFTQQDNVPAILAPFAILILAGLMAVYIAAVFWISWRLWVKGPLRVLLFAAVWMLFEFARGYLFTGFPWHLAGTMWADWLPVAQLASAVSIYGLSALTVLSFSAFSLFLYKNLSVPVISAVVSMVVVFATGTLWGQMRLENNTTEYDLAVSLRLVQANVKQRDKWRSYLIDDHFDKHMKLSRGGNERGRAEGVKLLIWPETAVQRESFDREASLLRWRMSRMLEFGSYAITGAPRYSVTAEGASYYNSLFALNSRGQLYAKYDKKHLVPFGEYLPFRGLLKAIGLEQLTGGVAFTPGKVVETIHLPGVPSFSPLICYEVIFPGRVVSQEDRPEWLLNITNDGWFGLTNGPYQHLGLARFRAIEEGLPLVRSASTGVSAVIDSYGRTVSSLAVDQTGILDSPLPLPLDAPAYSTGFKMMITLLLTLFVAVAFLAPAIVNARRGAGGRAK